MNFVKNSLTVAVFGVLFILSLSVFVSASQAEDAPAVASGGGQVTQEGPVVPQVRANVPLAQPVKPKYSYIYEKPTRKKFSRLYWALGMLDPKVDVNIDNYMMFNECDIYKEFYFNEFEWKEIREGARSFLINNHKTFPLRFEYVQLIQLGEYDLQRQIFEIQPEFRIIETTRVEVMPEDYGQHACLQAGAVFLENRISGYPIGVIAELNRPLNIAAIPVNESLAKEYIEEKMLSFKKLSESKRNLANLYYYRDAYIFMQMKFFSYKGQVMNGEGAAMAEILAVLEGIEIYADKDKKKLLWAQDFRRKKSDKKHDLRDIELEEEPLDMNKGAPEKKPKTVGEIKLDDVTEKE